MGEHESVADETITQFITEQTQMNETTRLFMEQQSKKMDERDEQHAKTMLLITKLLEREAKEPAKKKARKDNPAIEEAIPSSSSQTNTVEP